MMAMECDPPERVGRERRVLWRSGGENFGRAEAHCPATLVAVSECVEITRHISEMTSSGSCDQSSAVMAKPACPKRNFSTASSTCDDMTDGESMQELKRQKRLRANENERRRSEGINNCIKEQAERLRKYTDLDVNKLGKKGTMQEFTRCFDMLQEAQNYPPAVLELAARLVQSGCTPSSIANSAGHPQFTSKDSLTTTTMQRDVPPSYSDWMTPPAKQSPPMTQLPTTPKQHCSTNPNTGPEHATPPLAQPQASVNVGTTSTVPMGTTTLPVMQIPGYSTPMSVPYYQPTCVQHQQQQQAQHTANAAQPMYIPITPQSIVAPQSMPQPMIVFNPHPCMSTPQSSESLSTMSARPTLGTVTMKRPSNDDSSSSENSTPPPPKMPCRATCGADGLQQTPSRPAADRNGVSNNLAILASACALKRELGDDDSGSSDMDDDRLSTCTHTGN